MALQYQNIEEPSFSRGIDARSAENQIRDGFVRDLVNSDIVEGRAKKRKGYANYAGNLPVRVTAVRQIGAPVEKTGFVLDRSIDLSEVDITPLLVYGKYSGSVANDSVAYYTQWETSIKKAFVATTPPGPSTITVPVAEHNIDSPYIYTGTILHAVPGLNAEIIHVDSTTVDNANYDIDLNYYNYTGIPKEVYVYYKDGRAILGETAVIPKVVGSAGVQQFSVPATGINGHNLSLGTIIYHLYRDTGAYLEKVVPEEVILNSANNELTFKVDYYQPANYVVMVFAAPVSQSITISPSFDNLNQDYRVTLPNVTSRYLFYSIYHDSTGEEILPDSVLYDEVNNSVTFVFARELYEANPGALRIYYDYGSVRANEILVSTGGVSTNYFSDPQLTIYGLSHGDIYDAANPNNVLIPGIYGSGKDNLRRGWANHIDSYRSPTTTHMVAGLGGNLFAALSPSDKYFPPALLSATPTYYPKLNAKTISSTQNIGPAFWDTSDNPGLTRAILKFAGGGTNWATVTGIKHISGNTVRYTLSVPGGTVVGGTINNVISVTPGLEDYLTVKGMSHSRHNGNFKITSRSLVGNVLTLDVINPRIKNSDYDDSGCAGLGGIFTDRINLSAASPFLAEDILRSPAWSSNTKLLVQSSSSSSIVASQVFGKITLSPGVTITGKRTSAEIPLRKLNANDSITILNLVVGDTVYLSGIERPLQILAIDTINNIITVDESLTWEDSISLPTPLSVAQRWIPAETPVPSSGDPDYALIPKTTVQHLSSNPYDNQPFLRSAMVQNNLYLTNGNDEVYKYDGQHFYRAGIIPWQPGLFLSVENVATGGIPLSGSGAQVVSALEGAQLRLTASPANYFQVGDRVRFTNAEGVNQLLTVKAINAIASSTDKLFSFEDTLDFTSLGTTPRLTLVYQARYYFRLNVKDANGVTVSSAVTGALDFVASISPEIGKPLKVLLRLVGLPPWDRYDFRNKNIELEVYRTLWSRGSLGEVPTFYRIQSVGLTYENNSGYIDITDVYSNQTLTDSQQDFLVGALSAEGPPADWDEPARAKYVTTAGNRLVLANVTDWPTLTVTYLGAGLTTFASFAGQKFLYKRDSADTATLTDMLDRVTYELVPSSAAKTIYPVAGTSGHFKFSATTALPATLAPKDWVYLYHSAVGSGNSQVVTVSASTDKFSVTTDIPNGTLVHFSVSGTGTYPTYVDGAGTTSISPNRGYFVVDSGSNELKIALTYGGAALDIATNGTPTLNLLWDGSELDYAGWYQVADVTSGVVTIHSPNLNWSVIPPQFPDKALFATNLEDIPVLVGTDGNMGMVNGNGPLPWLVVLRRLGMAINASMRVTDTTLAGQTDFVPWLVARSEGDTDGQLIVKQPRAEVTTPSLTIKGPTTTVNGAVTDSSTVTLTNASQFQSSGTLLIEGKIYSYTGKAGNIISGLSPLLTASNGVNVEGGIGVSTYVNGALTNVGTATNLVTTRYPSRLLVSYDNYPEIFDNPWTVNTDASDSAIDVNSADGQEITGVIPFFGESAFGAALQSGVLVVFKQNSIYLVDLSAKAAGQNPVQRLETQGLGCTAPYSIASTKDGIAFANDSGIYVLRRNQRIEYLGRFMERNWQQQVDKNSLDLVQGHHYGVGRQYKLSVPLAGESQDGHAANSEVYVYNHTGETADEPGGWSRYTNHPATGWANLFQDAFFSTSNGTVKRIRNEGDTSDYRDDNFAIESILEARATAYGNTGVRKVVSSVTIHYRSGGNSTNTSVYMSPDLYQEYDLSSSFRILAKPGIVDGLGTVAGQDVVSIMHSFPKRRCIYMSVKIVNNGKDENVELAGFSYSVAGLSGAGVKQAGETE